MKSQRQCYIRMDSVRNVTVYVDHSTRAVYVKSTVTLIISTLSYGRMILFLCIHLIIYYYEFKNRDFNTQVYNMAFD